jgi:hypothetical protein
MMGLLVLMRSTALIECPPNPEIWQAEKGVYESNSRYSEEKDK